jgi:predicted RNA-binding protein
MCDFTVYLEENGERTVVATDVIKARKKDGTVFLMDIMGDTTRIEAVTIEVADTMMQEMVLKKVECN